MSWHRFPHVPELGAHIIALYKGCKDANYFELTIHESDAWSPLEKWCYYDDFKEMLHRNRKNAKFN